MKIQVLQKVYHKLRILGKRKTYICNEAKEKVSVLNYIEQSFLVTKAKRKCNYL